MSVKVRPYRRGGWEVDIRVMLPDGSRGRERKRAPVSSRSAALRWGQGRERELLIHGRPASQRDRREVPTLEAFAGRFVHRYAQANRQKPSTIATKQSLLRVHLIPMLGVTRLDAITTEDVQQLKQALSGKAPKTVNNVISVLSTLLKTAVEWGVIERVPCTIRMLKVPKSSAVFHDFETYERLLTAARATGPQVALMVLLGGEAGLRC